MFSRIASSRPVVAIYKDELLPPSQTFVLLQAEALKHHVPIYVSSCRIRNGLSLPSDRWIAVNNGGFVGAIKASAFRICGFAPALFKQLKAANPILVHSHFGLDGLRGRFLSRKLGVPLVVTFHGYDATIVPESAPSRRFRSYIRNRHLLFNDAALFIAVSQHIKTKLLSQGFPAEKIVVHYIGIDPEFFEADPAIARESIVLFVGRLVEKKGCEYLIKAMSLVKSLNPHVRLVVIGDGQLRGRLEQLARESGTSTMFLGIKSQQEIRHWMNRAMVFSVPSVTAANGDQEGFGLVFAEAQAMGLPVVSFSSGGIPEAVAHGVTGFLVSERDSAGLAHYIAKVLADAPLWHKMSCAGISRVRSQFDIRVQTRTLEGLYSLVSREALPGARDARQLENSEVLTS